MAQMIPAHAITVLRGPTDDAEIIIFEGDK